MQHLQKLKLFLVTFILSFCLVASIAHADQSFQDKRTDQAWQQKPQGIFAVSNSMYDILIKVDNDTLNKYSSIYSIKKGFSGIIDRESLNSIINESRVVKQVAGGGSINTIAGFVSLGGSSALTSVVSLDKFGKKFYTSITHEGIVPMIKFRKKSSTGVVLILITPDGEKTMFASQGVGLNFVSSDINYDAIKQYKVVLTDAYALLDKNFKKIFLKTISEAKGSNTHTAFSLSANYVAVRYRDLIISNIPNINILFGNKSEVMALFNASDFDQAIVEFQKIGNIGVFTMAEEGAVIVTKQGIIRISSQKIDKVIDTTGAGDMFAAGFLYGYTRGMDLETCGIIGSKAAAYIIQQIGARPEQKLSTVLRDHISSLK